MADCHLQWTLSGHKGLINTLSFSENSTYLTSGGLNCQGSFEWVWMEMVFDGAIEHVKTDEAQNVLAVTGMGRIAVYVIKADGTSSASYTKHLSLLIMPLIHIHPPLLEKRLPVLPIMAHFYEQGHCLMVSFLDAREFGNTAYHDASGTLLVWNLVDGIEIYQFISQPTVCVTFIRKIQLQWRRNYISQLCLDARGQIGVCGGDNGEVYTWNIELQAVQVVAHHSSQYTKHCIASGTSEPEDRHPYIKVWSSKIKQNTKHA
ncbi:hypothetical protein PAXINDRAFT_157731 [Paxillus involutus ATCC 200175]|uniref:Uncharacterized protein n=1 Tax=Paxillus involutus ATCC 200175 TaxID=664439 RepID=A0A0C9TS36_PAXIN|nr:hypothetical protein PAXINDRAFT_157731 [Paxillus involutus ATCC 200175]